MGGSMRLKILAVAAAFVLVAGVSACAPEPTESAKPSPSPATSKPATQAPTTSAPPTTTPTTAAPDPEPVAWERFTDARIPHSFEIPPEWSVSELNASDEMGIYQFAVLNPAGQQKLVFANDVQGLGGACGELPAMTIEELDSQPVEIPGYVAAPDGVSELVAPRVVFRAAAVEEGVIASLSLADDVPPNTCMYYNLMHTDTGLTLFADRMQVDTYDPHSQRLFASMDEARAYTQTEEYAQLVRILSSLQLAA